MLHYICRITDKYLTEIFLQSRPPVNMWECKNNPSFQTYSNPQSVNNNSYITYVYSPVYALQ
jgi:hypothetical protein